MLRVVRPYRSTVAVGCGLFLLLVLTATQEASAQGFGPRIGIHGQTRQNGVDDNYSDLRAFIPFGDEERLFFFDTRLLADENSDLGYNLGGGLRGYLEGADAVWGLNVFTDQRQTPYATYRQMGFGWELFFDELQFRNNFYMPISHDRTVLSTYSTGIVGGGSPMLRFQDYFLLYGGTYGQESEIEQSLRGFDFEVGGPLTDDQINWGVLSGYVGGYYYDNPSLQDAPGITGRLNANFSNSIDVNLGIQHDRFFKTQVVFGMTIYSDLFKRDRPMYRDVVRDRMDDPVYRKSVITVARGTIDAGPIELEERLKNPDGTDLRIVHVNSAAADGGDGTYEEPLNDVSGVEPVSKVNDIVYLYSDSTFDGQGTLRLRDRQRLLGEGGGAVYEIDTLQLGFVTLPAGNGSGGAIPIFQNSMGPSVALASNTWATNFTINDPQSGAAIIGNHAANALVDNVTINTTGDSVEGIYLTGNSSVTAGENTNITSLGARAYGAYVQDSSSLIFNSSNNIKTAGLEAYGVYAVDSSSVTIGNKSNIETLGAEVHGIFADDNSWVTLDGGSTVSTAGLDAHGIYAENSSRVSVDGQSRISTLGVFAHGIETVGSSTATVDNASRITTFGGFTHGVRAADSSKVTIDNGSEIITKGGEAFGILAEDSSKVVVDHESTIHTVGADSQGVFADNFSTVRIDNGSRVTTAGILSDGLQAVGSSQVIVDNKSRINTVGADAVGIWLQDSSKATVDDGSEINTLGSRCVWCLCDNRLVGVDR